MIPDTAAEKPDQGEVIAVGPGKTRRQRQLRRRSTSRSATKSCSASTRGQTVKVDGDELLVMREEDIIGVVEADRDRSRNPN